MAESSDVPRRAALVALIPLAVSVAAAIAIVVKSRTWLPVGDEAAMLIRARDVASFHPPAIGVYSTRGFAHPGPAPFAIVALVSGFGMFRGSLPLAAMCVLNGLVGGFFVWRAGRDANRRVQFATLAAVVAALVGLGGRNVASFWNPYSAVMWMVGGFVACACIAAGVVRRDRVGVWTAMAVGALSVAVQCHVAFLPFAAIAAVFLAFGLARSYRGAASQRVLAVAGGVAAVVWVGPVVDALWGSHNVTRLWRYFRADHVDALGIGTGVRLAGLTVCPWCDIATARYHHGWVGVTGVSPFVWPAGLAATALLIVLMARSSARSRYVPIAAMAFVCVGAAAPMAARLYGVTFDYLISWMIPVWALVVFAVVVAVPPLPTAWRDRLMRLEPVAGVGVAVLAAAAMVPLASLPAGPGETAIRRAAAAIEADAGNHRIRVEIADDVIARVGPGVVGQLLRDGARLTTDDGSVGLKWGRTHVAHRGPAPQRTYVLAVRYRLDDWSATDRCVITTGRRVGRFSSLSPSQENRLFALRADAVAPSGLTPSQVAERRRLEDRAAEIVVMEMDGDTADSVLRRCRR